MQKTSYDLPFSFVAENPTDQCLENIKFMGVNQIGTNFRPKHIVLTCPQYEHYKDSLSSNSYGLLLFNIIESPRTIDLLVIEGLNAKDFSDNSITFLDKDANGLNFSIQVDSSDKKKIRVFNPYDKQIEEINTEQSSTGIKDLVKGHPDCPLENWECGFTNDAVFINHSFPMSCFSEITIKKFPANTTLTFHFYTPIVLRENEKVGKG